MSSSWSDTRAHEREAPFDRRQRVGLRVLQRDVLLEHVPAGVAVGPELGEDIGDARGAVAERAEETLLHRRSVGDTPFPAGIADRCLRVLPTYLPHPPSAP